MLFVNPVFLRIFTEVSPQTSLTNSFSLRSLLHYQIRQIIDKKKQAAHMSLVTEEVKILRLLRGSPRGTSVAYPERFGRFLQPHGYRFLAGKTEKFYVFIISFRISNYFFHFF